MTVILRNCGSYFEEITQLFRGIVTVILGNYDSYFWILLCYLLIIQELKLLMRWYIIVEKHATSYPVPVQEEAFVIHNVNFTVQKNDVQVSEPIIYTSLFASHIQTNIGGPSKTNARTCII